MKDEQTVDANSGLEEEKKHRTNKETGHDYETLTEEIEERIRDEQTTQERETREEGREETIEETIEETTPSSNEERTGDAEQKDRDGRTSRKRHQYRKT